MSHRIWIFLFWVVSLCREPPGSICLHPLVLGYIGVHLYVGIRTEVLTCVMQAPYSLSHLPNLRSSTSQTLICGTRQPQLHPYHPTFAVLYVVVCMRIAPKAHIIECFVHSWWNWEELSMVLLRCVHREVLGFQKSSPQYHLLLSSIQLICIRNH